MTCLNCEHNAIKLWWSTDAIRFFAKYHPFLPFLDPSRSAEEYQAASPFLFFSILCIAARRPVSEHMISPESHSNLATAVINLAWTTISAPLVLELTSVQALVLLSTWPYYSSNISRETGLYFSSIALSWAQKFGLHRPLKSVDFVGPHGSSSMQDNNFEMEEYKRTWAACLITAQNIAYDSGTPHLSHLGSTFSALDPSGSLYSTLALQNFLNRALDLLFEGSLDSESHNDGIGRAGARALLEDQFSSLLSRLELNSLDSIKRLEVSFIRFALTTSVFLDSRGSLDRKENLLKALAAASEYITELVATDSAEDILVYAPSSLFRRLFCAACVVLRILSTQLSDSLDKNTTALVFHTAVLALRRCAINDTDLPARFVSILSSMWRIKEQGSNRHESQEPAHTSDNARLTPRPDFEDEPVLEIRSRGIASITYDCAWRWTQARRQQARAEGADFDTMDFEIMSWLWNDNIPDLLEE